MAMFRKWWTSIKYAWQGIRFTLRFERNMRIHLMAVMVVIALAAFFGFSLFEWVILILTIGFVVCLELVNTAIEQAVNLASLEQNAYAKNAKDAAAGAVLMSAILSVIVGILLFYPHIAALIRSYS